jgi:hypothetical protein
VVVVGGGVEIVVCGVVVGGVVVVGVVVVVVSFSPPQAANSNVEIRSSDISHAHLFISCLLYLY